MEHDLDQLFQFTPQEQAIFEREQNLYSLIKTIEYLEWAYMSGKIDGPKYDQEFRKLLHNYQETEKGIPQFMGIDQFVKKYQLDHCQTAMQRIKAKKSGYQGEEMNQGLAVRVLEIT